jgi:hypothetical protein
MSTNPKSTIQTLKQGSLVRVTLPSFEGKYAIGTVQNLQAYFIAGNVPYMLIWVEMHVDGVVRPFELENLEPVPAYVNGWVGEYVSQLMTDYAVEV